MSHLPPGPAISVVLFQFSFLKFAKIHMSNTVCTILVFSTLGENLPPVSMKLLNILPTVSTTSVFTFFTLTMMTLAVNLPQEYICDYAKKVEMVRIDT